nr:hypothetical protein Iba_chr13eCG3530 [Ipomoea batatas]
MSPKTGFNSILNEYLMFVRFISGIAIGIYWFPDSIELD